MKSLRWRLLRAQYATRKVSHRATRTRRGHLATYAGSDHPAAAETAFAAIRENPQLNWSFVQRGLWVHGVDTLTDYLRVCIAFRLSDRVGAISCPTLITAAENDPVAAFAGHLYDALTCPKTLIRFTAAEGAGDHCEVSARSVYFQRAYDWLDDVFGMR